MNYGVMGNNIYAAATGSGYESLLRFLLLNLQLINIEVHLYPDADIPDYKITRIKKNLFLDKVNFYIHRNTYPGEKDFGVKKEKIQKKK